MSDKSARSPSILEYTIVLVAVFVITLTLIIGRMLHLVSDESWEKWTKYASNS